MDHHTSPGIRLALSLIWCDAVHQEGIQPEGKYMAVPPLLTAEELDALRRFDTCMIANAVEKFNIRLHNLHGDEHGVITIPAEIAAEVPKVAAGLLEAEQ